MSVVTRSARASPKMPTSARRYSLRLPLRPVPARRRRPRNVSVRCTSICTGATPGRATGTPWLRAGCLAHICSATPRDHGATPCEWSMDMAREISPSRMSSSTSVMSASWLSARVRRRRRDCVARARASTSHLTSRRRLPTRHAEKRWSSSWVVRCEPRVPRRGPRKSKSLSSMCHLSPRSTASASCLCNACCRYSNTNTCAVAQSARKPSGTSDTCPYGDTMHCTGVKSSTASHSPTRPGARRASGCRERAGRSTVVQRLACIMPSHCSIVWRS